jgi:hypothetical protein
VPSKQGKCCFVMALCVLAAPLRAAEPVPEIAKSADHVEAVQSRAWLKRGAFVLEPTASYAFNDPFLVRGGFGGRVVWWPRSLLGLSVEASGWSQAPSEDARVAQRELRAQLRATGSSWMALAGAEIAAADGKLALGGGILPFELLLRLGAGAASSRDAVTSTPALALSAGVAMRWFLSERWGLDTALSWRSASITRSIDGALVPARDTAVSFEVGVPFRLGGQ